MTLTTTSPMTVPASSSSSASDGGHQKDFLDFLGGLIPDAAQAAAPVLGIDPRVAGQTVSDVLSIFGIGGGGKAFTPAIPKEQAVSQLEQVVTPYLGDQAFTAGLGAWLKAALEPVEASKAGKAYQPSVDLSKNWFTDAVSSIGDAIGSAASSIPWQQVGQVGMQMLPTLLAAAA